MKIGGYEVQVPFVTTSSDSLKTIIESAQYKQYEVYSEQSRRAIDLGSGDGRVALELAKNGFLVTGIEHNEALVARAKTRAQELNLKNIAFLNQDFWDVDLRPFDVIYIYGMDSIMGRLEKKLDEEMRHGARFISNVFTLPHWKVKKTKNNVHLYIKTANS